MLTDTNDFDTQPIDEALDCLSEDLQDADYGDHLSEQLSERVREYLPRDTVAFGTVDTEYAEALIERRELINGREVDLVTTAMVDPNLASDRISGVLTSAIQEDGTELVVLFEATDEGFRYKVFFGGMWLATFPEHRMATVAFRALSGQKPELYKAIIRATWRAFRRRS